MRVDFKRVDVMIAQSGSPPAINSAVIVCWEIVPIHTGAGLIRFQLERSLSPAFVADETDVVAENIPGADGQSTYVYVDVVPSLINWWRMYFYRIRATYTPDVTYSNPRTWEKSPKTYELAIIERHDFLLSEITGTPTFVFIERTADSAPCLECWDKTAGRTTKASCERCLGTGKERPFFDPILIWVDYNPGLHIIQMASFGEIQAKQRTCWTSAYPILKPGDVLYTCGAGDLYRIAKIGPNAAPQDVTLMQVATLEGIDRSNVEHRGLPQRIDQQVLLDIMQAWDVTRQRRMF